MKVRQKRLFDLLRDHGFASSSTSRISGGWTFVRSSHIDELFESIIVESQGKRGEAVYASVGIAVTHTVMYKLLGDVQFLDEFGEDPQRGWAIIEDDGKARQWEKRVADIGPLRAKGLANNLGQQILRKTSQVRAVVKKYQSMLEPTKNLDQALAVLKNACSHEVAVEAEQLACCPIFENEDERGLIYRIACYVIIRHSAEVEGHCFIGHDPMNDDALLERIELLADKLFRVTDPEQACAQ